VQSALIADCLPRFADENRLPVLDPTVQPRIWFGSAVTTPTHFDESNNVACVVAGTRRFTLFPPEQIANLYVGPLGHAPTGTPISLASLANPDFKQFPRLREALANAFVAVLEPGDALYIPALWWHHVESLAKYNILVNYWWKGNPEAVTNADTALNCPAALPADAAAAAARAARRMACPFRPLHFQCRCRVVRLHTRACSRRAG
jgi:hypothetical protein